MSEVSHFTKLASTWWDVRGPQRILHKMNAMRMDFINQTIPLKPHTQCLDIGCGGGLLSESLARKPQVSKVLGIDITPKVIETAKSHMQLDPQLNSKLSYQLMNLDDVKQKFDFISMFELLEHVDNPKGLLNQALDLLNPGGHLVLSTINRTPASFISTILFGEYLLRIVPIGTHTYSKYVNSKEIENMIPENCTVLKTLGCIYLPFSDWLKFGNSGILGNLIGTTGGNFLMAIEKSR